MNITVDGVGSIHPGMAFDPKLIQMTCPGFEVEKVSPISPGEPLPLLILKRGKSDILYLVSDPAGEKISQISVISPLPKDKRGQGILDPIRKEADLVCEEELCRYRDQPSITYRIDPAARTIREITVQRL